MRLLIICLLVLSTYCARGQTDYGSVNGLVRFFDQKGTMPDSGAIVIVFKDTVNYPNQNPNIASSSRLSDTIQAMKSFCDNVEFEKSLSPKRKKVLPDMVNEGEITSGEYVKLLKDYKVSCTRFDKMLAWIKKVSITTAITNSDGSFTLSLPPGRYSILCKSNNVHQKSLPFSHGDMYIIDVTVVGNNTSYPIIQFWQSS